MMDMNDILIELTNKNGEIQIVLYRFEGKSKMRVDIKALHPDERKVAIRKYYELIVQGSRKFAEISNV